MMQVVLGYPWMHAERNATRLRFRRFIRHNTASAYVRFFVSRADKAAFAFERTRKLKLAFDQCEVWPFSLNQWTKMVKVIWQKGRIAAARGRFNVIRQMAPVCIPPNTCFLGPTMSKSQTTSRAVQLSFCKAHGRESVYITTGCSFAPSDAGIWTPLIHGCCFDPPESSTQTASRLVQPFLQGSILWQTDRQKDWQTTLLGNNKMQKYLTV